MNSDQLLRELETAGVRLWEEAGELHFLAPRGVMTEERRAALRKLKGAIIAHLNLDERSPFVSDDEARYEPFPLTDVQTAYLLGRRDAFEYGNVGCHGYGELSFASLDPSRIESAWQAMIERHDMLRATIDADCSQRVLARTPKYKIKVADLRGKSRAAATAAIEAARAEMSHRVYRGDRWPLFELRVTLFDQHAVLHLSIDFLIADFVSIQLLLDELHARYRDPCGEWPALRVTFRDYLLAEKKLHAGHRYQRDRAYWWRRLDDLPLRPDLPRASPLQITVAPKFRRWQTRLTRATWQSLRRQARIRGLPPSGAILAAYVEVLARWSRNPRFVVNTTLLNRLPLHGDVGQLVGDFTSVTLLAVERDEDSTFEARARALQGQLWDDLDHRLYSGVEVIREIARRRGPTDALMPIVFTSAIGLGPAEKHERGTLIYGISQTPQVWIDCQTIENDDGLMTNWDVREGVFPDGLIDGMFEAYEALLMRLAKCDDAWQNPSPVDLPAAQKVRRQLVSPTKRPVPNELLHQAVVAQATQTPNQIALVTPSGSLSYRELLETSAGIATALREAGCGPGEIVAIVANKGWHQVVAVLGTLLVGAAYVPIDASQPAARRDRMLADARVKFVLIGCGPGQTWPCSIIPIMIADVPAVPATALPEVPTRPSDLAYVIYTSGTSGVPKGVMISHQAARNTIDDVSRRFGLGSDDRVLGLAPLSFDLSVYDIFGPLGVGGCLVLPSHEQRADPGHWAGLIADHEVTIWNSVPAQAQMLLDYLESCPEITLPTIRLGFLSGDWIPVNLPERARQRIPSLQLVSLGGATEAAIWSILHPIGHLPSDARSVPYGTPLTNQTIHVLDSALRPCPDWVAGELAIGGAGLALGYLGDPALTAERFIRHPSDGERLYLTGDFGCYLPDGTIEFLGREDRQVKVRGHRIELAEIEAALLTDPAVAAAVVVADSKLSGPRLVACVEPARKEPPPHDQASARSRRAQCDEARSKLDADEVIALAKRLDNAALLAMLCTLRDYGLFSTPDSVQTMNEILAAIRVVPKHQRLVRRWLQGLERHGFLVRDAYGHYSGAPSVDRSDVAAAWRKIDASQVGSDGGELIGYFRLTSTKLGNLLRGELDPVQLLFPNGSTDIQKSAYNDMPLARYLNRIAVMALTESVRCRQASGPMRILEVGAGVGGTSIELINALAPFEVDYLFTDVSQFFLNHAAERFSSFPWVRYDIFNINGDYRAQGLEPNTFDAVVCANVLHYAQDAADALSKLRGLLVPEGALVAVETMRDNYQILTSMEFLFDEKIVDFGDVRRGKDETFLTPDQWLDAIEAAGGVIETWAPDFDDPIAEIGMAAFSVRFKRDRIGISRDDIRSRLTTLLPEYAIPSHFVVLDELPLTANGKVDHDAVREWLPRESDKRVVPAHAQPRGELETLLATSWSGVLRIENIGRDRNFFELGGDSLVGAQLAGAIVDVLSERAPPFDALLRELLQGATVASLANMIREYRVENKESVDDGAFFGGAEVGDPVVLVYGGVDTLPEASRVVQLLFSREVTLGIAFHGHFLQERATEYSVSLFRAGHRQIQILGFEDGAILAVEIARRLLEAGVTVELAIAASARPSQQVSSYAGDLSLLGLREPFVPVADVEAFWRELCLGQVRIVDDAAISALLADAAPIA